MFLGLDIGTSAVKAVLVDGREPHAMLGRDGFQSSGVDVGHHPLATAHLDELPRLGASVICLRLPFVLDAHVMTIFPISSS